MSQHEHRWQAVGIVGGEATPGFRGRPAVAQSCECGQVRAVVLDVVVPASAAARAVPDDSSYRGRTGRSAASGGDRRGDV